MLSPGAIVGSVSTSVDLCRPLSTSFESEPAELEGLQQLTISHLCLQHSIITDQIIAQGHALERKIGSLFSKNSLHGMLNTHRCATDRDKELEPLRAPLHVPADAL